MNDSIGFIAVFFLPFIAYVLYFRIRLDMDHSARRQKVCHRGRHFCGVDACGRCVLTDPFCEDAQAIEVPEMALASVPNLQCWEPVQ
jgi:hypothetical protein